MAKSSRYTGGYYLNAMHAADESEGSGSSGRIDTEITVSEDSSMPPFRKCVNLNTTNQDRFGVPMQVLPVSNMSRFQRKDLIHRLRTELENIQGLQKKVELQRNNAHTLSSDLLSCSNGQKGPKVNSLKKSSTLKSEPEKKLNIHGHKGQNKGSAAKFELVPPASVIQASASSSANSNLIKQCEALLKRLMTHQYAWVFNAPVDVVKLNIPDYLTIIKQPMDLGTVKNKIVSGAYSNPLEFLADVRLTFGNAMTYNPPGNDVHVMADTLSKYFEVRWKSIEKKLPKADDMPLPAKPDVCEDTEIVRPMPPAKNRKTNTVATEPEGPEHNREPPKRVMTIEEKHRLGRELESLIGEIPMDIIDVLREHTNGQECGEDEIEIDIDDLSDNTLFTLRKLLDDYLKEKQRNHEKAEPCEMELINDSGPSNSSVQPCKADEEVDVGGNEPPVSSYCRIELGKDVAQRSSQNLSQGNTYDSDSSSFSENESDNYKRSSENMPRVLENLSCSVEDEKTRTVDHPERTETSGLDQLEQAAQQKPRSVVSDCHQDGESAPMKKHLRAALLKKRFADTILKAREKTFLKGEKLDPEKLRQKREKLEIEQQKEKARLQAEAKAAEEARKRAEVEAAAEARRKRELEREAARQALLQMEKTVEISENSRFLEDLEMLRAAPADQLPSSVDETSPDHSPDGLGSFKFGGSNPLEQLGLYIKEDEEEEEGEPPCVPNSENDVEGEIDVVD